jgi:hypothetical protein
MALDSEELTMDDKELINSLYQIATLGCLLSGKKHQLQNIFLMFLTDSHFNKIVKEKLDMESNVEICRQFLLLEPNLVKSKLLTSFKLGD